MLAIKKQIFRSCRIHKCAKNVWWPFSSVTFFYDKRIKSFLISSHIIRQQFIHILLGKNNKCKQVAELKPILFTLGHKTIPIHHPPVACPGQISAGNQNALPINWFTQSPPPANMSDLANSCHRVIIMSVTGFWADMSILVKCSRQVFVFTSQRILVFARENK